MKSRKSRSAVLVAFALATLLAGCASPDEVRNLTRETNKNIGQVSKALQNFEKRSEAIQKQLAMEIDRANTDAAENELRLQKNLTIWQLAGAKHKERFLAKMRSLVEILAKSEQMKSAADGKRRQKEILDTLEASKAPSAELKVLREKIAELLKSDDSLKSRLKTLLEYSKDVAKEVKGADEKK